MNKKELVEEIQKLSVELDTLASQLETQLKTSKELKVEGRFQCKKHGNRIEYIQILPDGKQKYIERSNKQLLSALAKKQHYTSALNAARKEQEQIRKCLSILDSGRGVSDIDDVYPSLHEGIRKLTGPLTVSDDGYAILWERKMRHLSNGVKTINGDLKTAKGECVKSKSEVIIADRLHHAGVPYVYEVTLSFNDGTNFLYPDFIVLNKRTRKEYVWEHLGMMDNKDYCHKNLIKLEAFARSGFILGKNMIITMESSSKMLNTSYVDTLIKEYLI